MGKLSIINPANANLPTLVASQVAGGVFDRFLSAWETSKKCKVAIRQLEVEEVRICKEASLKHAEINTEYRLRMEALRVREQVFDRKMEELGREISNRHVRKMELLKVAGQAQAAGYLEFAGQCLMLMGEMEAANLEQVAGLLPAPLDENNLLEG